MDTPNHHNLIEKHEQRRLELPSPILMDTPDMTQPVKLMKIAEKYGWPLRVVSISMYVKTRVVPSSKT